MKIVSWNIYVLGEYKEPIELLREAGIMSGIKWGLLRMWDKRNFSPDDGRIFGKTTYGSSNTFYAAIFPYRIYRSNT